MPLDRPAMSTPGPAARILTRLAVLALWAILPFDRGAHAAGDLASPLKPPVATFEAALDVRSSLVTGQMQLRSQPYDASSASSFALNLLNPDDAGDSLLLGSYFEGGYAVSVVAGTYLPEYGYQYGEAAPRNRAQPLATSLDASHHAVHDIDVPAVDVTASFLLNGQPFPQDAGETARFYLQPEGPGEPVLLGSSNGPPAAVTVLPGFYAIVYAYQSGSHIPVNQHAVVAARVRLTASRHLNVRVRSTMVESRVTLNGVLFPNDAYNYGRIALVNAAQGDRVELGETFGGILAASQVILGSYAAHYSVREGNGLVPMNPEAIFAKDVVVSRRTERLSLDVPSVTVAGPILVNGAPPPVSAYEYGRVGLRFAGTDAVLPLGETFAQSFGPLPVVAGTYEAVYSHREGSQMPRNTDAVFIEKLSLPSTGTYVLDIPVVNLSLELSLDGGPFPNSAYNFAYISAVPRGGDGTTLAPIRIGASFEGPLQINLLAGRYDLVYACHECAGQVPANRHAVFIEDRSLTASTAIVHDFLSRPVHLSATLNGLAFPSDPATDAEIYLGLDDADKVSFGRTAAGLTGGPIPLLRGRYQATYAVRATGDRSVVPINRNAVVGHFQID